MKPGPKPRATVVKLVTGNPGKRRLPKDEPRPDGRPKPPKPLSGRALALWKGYVSPAWWLSRADGQTAYMWALMAAEFEDAPQTMSASRIGQLRMLAQTLGFDPGSRARFGTPPERGAGSEYFD
jgi:hypothetical protein